MWIVLAGYCTLCSIFATLVACYFIPFGRWKVLFELLLVMMKGSPCSPELDVGPVSLIADGIVPFWTPILTSASVRWYFYF